MEIKLNISKKEALDLLAKEIILVPSFLFSVKEVWSAPKEKTIVGAIRENRFALRVRHKYSNGLILLLDGEIAETATGSILTAKFRRLKSINLFIKVLTIFYLSAGILWFNGQVCFANFVLLFPALLLITVDLIAYWLGKQDKKYLIQFMEGLFEEAR